MPRPSPFRLGLPGLLALVGGVALACGDPFAGTATFENQIDTVTIYAFTGTSIRLPSAYSIIDQMPVRTTDAESTFDFAFDIDSAGRALIYPSGALELNPDPGIQLMDRAFDAVKSAPIDGYTRDSAVVVGNDNVFVVSSQITTRLPCAFFAALPRYAKFRVLIIDQTARSIVLESLVNLNCGFRGLEPGIPSS